MTSAFPDLHTPVTGAYLAMEQNVSARPETLFKTFLHLDKTFIFISLYAVWCRTRDEFVHFCNVLWLSSRIV